MAQPSWSKADTPIVLMISGVNEAQEKNIKATLMIAHQTSSAKKTAIDLAASRAIDELGGALQPFGYFSPEITSSSIVRKDDNWWVSFAINPGPAMRISSLDIKLLGAAEHEPPLQQLVHNFPLKAGDVLDQVSYERGRDALLHKASEMGLFDAHFSLHEVTVDLDTNKAQIHLTLDSGQRYRFGVLSFSETPLSKELLDRFVRFKADDPYDETAVVKTQKSLLNSGFFNKADITPKLDKAVDSRVPMSADLEMAPQNRFDLGGGYGTDTGPRLSAGYRNRYINSYGHGFQASAKVSQIWNQVDAAYIIPLQDPERDQFAITSKLGIEDTVAGWASVIRGGLRHSTSVWDLRETLSVDFLRETFNIGTGNQTTDLLIPSANYSWVHSDDAIFPREGVRIDGNLAGSVQGVGSQLSFLRALFSGRGIYTFLNENSVIARGQIGQMVTSNFDQMPITERFYTGGASTVRGYRLFEISPLNAQGKRTGGTHMVVASLEYDRHLFGDWGFAVFSDMGYIGNDFSGPLNTGVGAGARWHSPVGPVRLDVGFPLQKALDPVQVYLILGPDL